MDREGRGERLHLGWDGEEIDGRGMVEWWKDRRDSGG